MAGEDGLADDGEQEEDEEDNLDPDAVGVAKMRVSEIKAELDVRGIGYAGIFEKVRAWRPTKEDVNHYHTAVCVRRSAKHDLPATLRYER